MAEEKGRSSFGFANYLDTCKEAHKRGNTIQCNTKECFTEKYHYIKNMITGSNATADVACSLFLLRKEGLSQPPTRPMQKLVLKRERPTSTHAFSTDLVLTRYTVCINKMDKCGWSEGQFNEIKD